MRFARTQRAVSTVCASSQGGASVEGWAFYRGECGPGGAVAEKPSEVPTSVLTEPATEIPTETPTAQPSETPTPAGPAETWVYVDLKPDETGRR